MRKRIISLALAVLMVVCLLPASALADGEIYGKSGDNITWQLNTDGSLYINGTGSLSGQGLPKDGVKMVFIGKGITEIQMAAFYEFPDLVSVNMADSVTQIKMGAFSDCKKLQSVRLSHNLTEIQMNAFSGCEALYSITLPDSLKFLGSEAFSGCKSLKRVDIPGGVETIDGRAFADCNGLRTLIVSEGVSKIGYNIVGSSSGNGAQGDFALSYVVLPSTLTCIDTSFNGIDGVNIHYTGSQAQWNKLIAVSKAKDQAFELNEKVNVVCNPFTDVAPNAYYCRPVMWAVEKEITNGVGGGLFAPNANCTRAQVVTFLWRWAGCPSSSNGALKASFTDVVGTTVSGMENPYYEAICWAAENNIANGIGGGKFAPDDTISRKDFVTLLFRYVESHGPILIITDNPFDDIEDDYAFEAILWASTNGITNGVSEGKFAPNDPCTRGQIVTFLYRVAY